MADDTQAIDLDKAGKTAEQVFGYLGGALVSAMIYLGDRMGLYLAMSGAGRSPAKNSHVRPDFMSAGFAVAIPAILRATD
jgi:hypothetical protein